MEYITNSATQTKKLAREIATTLKPGTILCLYGNLGVGKTAFIQGLALGLGIKTPITSPTFLLSRQYDNPKTTFWKKFIHIDLYRIKNTQELKNLGLGELLADQQAIIAIEWAEKLDRLPDGRLDIHMSTGEGNQRRININFLKQSHK